MEWRPFEKRLMDRIKGGGSPMKLCGQVLWGNVGKDRVLVILFPLGSRGCSGLNVQVFDCVGACSVIFEYSLMLSLLFFLYLYLVLSCGRWQHTLREHNVCEYTG